ncbi:MAG: hypothetical protein LAO31_15260 [Acidobacteriia bacterium]|nr:hypothetical protein [Terriglobia bacterium]
MFFRYFSGLRRFLRQPLTLEDCRRRILHQLQDRNESFLRIVERGIYGNPRSPYAKLLKHAGIDFTTVAALVRREGLEATLDRLYDAGVYVTFEEFKGRRPVHRSGLNFTVRPADFDNPLLARDYEMRTGGSRGVGTRIIVDFDLLTHEAAYHCLSIECLGLAGRPVAIWYGVPPVVSGLKHLLRSAKIDQRIERWFSLSPLVVRPKTLKYFVFTKYALYGSRLFGKPLPNPEYTPLENAHEVALWLAAKSREGSPAELHTNPSSGVRVCLVAKEHGLDISGTFFRFNSEPYTPGKAKIVAESGSRAAAQYSMGEIGNIGMACGTSAALDDIHLLTDKLAVIQREKQIQNSTVRVDALLYTTLLPSCPKLLLNVESDDYGKVERRKCNCLWGDLGFEQHIENIRSYDKLTSEGMTFFGSELISLVEDVLPSRFGGHATDYQFLEEEEDGLPRVNIVVSPRAGAIDEERLILTILDRLGSSLVLKSMMAERWREGRTLRVIRREPFASGAAKILPLHILRKP